MQKQTAMPEQMVSVAEAARVLGLTDGAFRRAIQRGQIPAFRIGRRVRVPVSALQSLLKPLSPVTPGR